MGGKGHPFFERLAALENTPQSLAAFDRYIDRPLDLPAPEFFASLYRSLIERYRLAKNCGRCFSDSLKKCHP